MVINYHLFLLTDFTSTDIQTLTGNSVIYFTCGNVALNIVTIFGPVIVDGVKRARRWCVHRKLRNQRRVAQMSEKKIELASAKNETVKDET
jgi:hypothetical protein